MGMYSEAVQRLYVAYFNRPADASGLAYWEGVVAAAGGNTSSVSAAFAGSDEYKRTYAGLDDAHTVQRVYQNLFGHDADTAGLQYWSDALARKLITVDNMVTQIAGGAQGSDKVAFDSKTSAAAAFTGALDTTSLVLAYSGDTANMVGKVFIASVTDSASLAAAIAPGSLQKIRDGFGIVVFSGQPASLTADVDRLSGTPGNDVFNAYAFDIVNGKPISTMSGTDFVDGGAGTDVLNIDISGGHNTAFGIILNVETINITEDVATPIDASAFTGAALIRQIGNAGAVSNLGADTVAGFSGATISGALSVSASDTRAAVSLDRVRDNVTLAVTGKQLQGVTVAGDRVHFGAGAQAPLALQVTAGKDVQSVTVKTDQATTLAVRENAASTTHVTSVDASASTGAINFDGTTMPGLQTIKTGSGNDIVYASKIGAATLTVLTGDGDDMVMLTGRVTAGDVIDGGAGNNTLVVAAYGTEASRDPIVSTIFKNFSTIKFIDTSSQSGLDASQLDHSFTSISLEVGSVVTGVTSQNIVAHGNLTASASGYAAGTSYGGNLNITELGGGTITANASGVSLALQANGNNLFATLDGDLKSASVNLANASDNPSNPHTDFIANLTVATNASTLRHLASLTMAGNGTANVINNGGDLVSVDASGLGGTLATTGDVTQGLTYRSTNAKAETIKLGSGVDHIRIGASTYDNMDTITGLKLVLNDAGTALATNSDRLTVDGVSTTVHAYSVGNQTSFDLALVQAAGSAQGQDIVFTFGGDTYIYHDTGANHVLDGNDILVKLTGTVDLRALVIALGGTAG